jgi:ABC-type uncharacterized transport system substrate-binding protein
MNQSKTDLEIVNESQFLRLGIIINLKAANALGIDFPLSLLGRADKVIE